MDTKNIVEAIVSCFDSNALSQIASTLGEEEGSVKKGVAALVPTLLASLCKAGSDSDRSFNGVMEAVQSFAGGSDNLGQFAKNPLAAVENDSSRVMSLASTVCDSLFGKSSSTILTALGTATGMSSGSAKSLMGMCAPVVFGKIKEVITSGGGAFTAASVVGLLKTAMPQIASSLPTGVSSLLGVTGNSFASTAGAAPKASSSWMPVVLTLVALGAGWLYFNSADDAMNKMAAMKDSVSDVANTATGAISGVADSATGAISDATDSATGAIAAATDGMQEIGEESKRAMLGGMDAAKDKMQAAGDAVTGAVDGAVEATTQAVDTAGEMVADTAATVGDVATDAAQGAADMTAKAVDTAGNVVADTAEAVTETVTLSSGQTLSFPSGKVESQLLAFVQDSSSTANTATWYDFDRLQFETGSATLKASSSEQIKNIAAILEANPSVAIKVGGYTDNTGSAQLNQSLSAKRAEAVVAAIAGQGIEVSRLASEGYGSQHPVASNDTAEGRAMNRRTSVKVTAK